MQLTLNDFDCKDAPPKWIPQEKWEDILALSVLPGPLDSLCVHLAQNSESWKAWYKSDYPEREPLPLSSSAGEEGMTTGKNEIKRKYFYCNQQHLIHFHILTFINVF